MNIDFLVGKEENITLASKIKAISPFNDIVLDFLNDLSKNLMNDSETKKYPDIITFAFFIRKANMIKYKEKFYHFNDNIMIQGIGNIFHIAPSNVPINFAYSLVTGLICGNGNYVKVSSKQFVQVDIVCNAINKILNDYVDLKQYINIFRYNNEKENTDLLSLLCDVRIIWGGNDTINLIRQSKIHERAREITFADRYSIAVIDLNYYNLLQDKEKDNIINGFYNDTYLSDQNACTSPRLICFVGNNGYDDFYDRLHKVVSKKYIFNDIYASNKYVYATKFATNFAELKPMLIRVSDDNLIYRIIIDKNIEIPESIIDYKGTCGTFLELQYDNVNELTKLHNIFNNNAMQTISYIGDKTMFDSILKMRLKGIDRIVKTGTSMDFDMIWDGYNLYEMLTRNISIN